MRNHGFSFIELLVVLVIIGLLSGIVYPIYIDYVRQSRRSDAWSALMTAAAQQERWFSVHYQYIDDIAMLGGATSKNGFYVLSVVADSTTFVIKATATQGLSQQNDLGCTELTVDHFGSQLPTACWR